MLCFVSYQSPSLVCQSKNFQRPTNRRALAGPFWRNSICGARMPWIHLDLLLRRSQACSSPPSPVLRAITIFTPGQPCLAPCPVLPVQATQATCPAVARLGLISGNSVTETEILGENRLQAERATVLTLPAYSRLFPRGKCTLQQLPLFTRAREP